MSGSLQAAQDGNSRFRMEFSVKAGEKRENAPIVAPQSRRPPPDAGLMPPKCLPSASFFGLGVAVCRSVSVSIASAMEHHLRRRRFSPRLYAHEIHGGYRHNCLFDSHTIGSTIFPAITRASFFSKIGYKVKRIPWKYLYWKAIIILMASFAPIPLFRAGFRQLSDITGRKSHRTNGTPCPGLKQYPDKQGYSGRRFHKNQDCIAQNIYAFGNRP